MQKIQKINIVYKGFDKNISRRDINIEAMYFYSDDENVIPSIYVLAFCNVRKDYRSFQINNIQEILDLDKNRVFMSKSNIYKWFYYEMVYFLDSSIIVLKRLIRK